MRYPVNKVYNGYDYKTNTTRTYYEYDPYCRYNDEDVAFFVYFGGCCHDADTAVIADYRIRPSTRA